MHKISVKDWLNKDFDLLKEEYLKDDISKYQKMYKKLIPLETREKLEKNELNSYQFDSVEKLFIGFNSGIKICVELYIKTTPYFYFPLNLDLEEYGIELREDPDFRDFTKFCFYIIETIPPK